MRQQSFEKTKWNHKHSHGGELRRKRAGRKARPLSTKRPLHLVFKANKVRVRGGLRSSRRFCLIQKILKQYSKRFWVRIEQVSVQSDHIHLIIRAPRRAKFADFFRVVAGQIAQRFENENLLTPQAVTGTPGGAIGGLVRLWKHRPFSRVVIGWRAYRIVRDYVQLNEQEALGTIRYQSRRLRGLSTQEWDRLWG